LVEREKLLRSGYPQYLFYDPIFGEHLEGVPNELISTLYQPNRKVLELLTKMDLDRVQTESIEFVRLIHDVSGIGFGKLGLSGSLLVGLHVEGSDIDLVAYGRENCMSVHEALKHLTHRSGSAVSPYSSEELKRLYEFRSKDTWMPLEDFLRIERRKFSQGTFKGRDFFARFILDWGEIDEKYGDRMYRTSGYARIEAMVKDDSEAIFTPCRYVVSQVEIIEGPKVPLVREIVSFRGRFCEQARKGETVVAQGKVEKVVEKDGTEYYRLILGAKPSDFMISR